MAVSFTEKLEQLRHAASAGAGAQDLDALVRALRIPPNSSAQELRALYRLVPDVVDKTNGLARWSLLSGIESTLCRGKGGLAGFPFSVREAEPYVTAFFDYLERHYASDVDSVYPVRAEWNLLLRGHPPVKDIVERHLGNLERAERKPPGYVAGMKKALELSERFERIARHVDLDAIDQWPDCVTLLDDPHPLVRAWAAKNLGALYRVDAEIVAEGLPTFFDMLQTLGSKEIRLAGVLGPFIDGYDDSALGLAALDCNEEIKERGFDVRTFVLEIMTRSPSETYCPDVQSLEFYAHEYFDCDAEGLMRLLRAGKQNVVEQAMAHDCAFEGRQEVLKRLG